MSSSAVLARTEELFSRAAIDNKNVTDYKYNLMNDLSIHVKK